MKLRKNISVLDFLNSRSKLFVDNKAVKIHGLKARAGAPTSNEFK